MPRARMSDAEREAKRRARSAHSFSDAAYRHYDTSRGYGSAAEWADAAEAMSGGRGALRFQPPRAKVDADLVWMGLVEMPDSIEVLIAAFRKAMFVHHPDHGGDLEAAKAALAAYGRLKDAY